MRQLLRKNGGFLHDGLGDLSDGLLDRPLHRHQQEALERAIQVNIQMRAFTQLRQMLATHDDLRRKIEEMEATYDEQFRIVFEAIRQLLATEER